MRFRPFARTVFSQAVALVALLAFLSLLNGARPVPVAVSAARPSHPVTGRIFASGEQPDEKSEPVTPPPEEEPRPEPREPERFRATRHQNDKPVQSELPKAVPDRRARQVVAVARRDLPLSYLTRFRDMEDFHAFLERLPEDTGPGSVMSLINMEGIPEDVGRLRRVLESYRMEPFLYNPLAFSYLITQDMRMIRDKGEVRSFIANVGRFVKLGAPNAAYAEIRASLVDRARSRPGIRRSFGSDGEFDRMQLGLASRYLSRFFRRLEQDTAHQLTELTGRPVGVRDITRISCRFRNVNGALVLVPMEAYLGADPTRTPIAIWREG